MYVVWIVFYEKRPCFAENVSRFTVTLLVTSQLFVQEMIFLQRQTGSAFVWFMKVQRKYQEMFAPKIISCAKTRACTPNPSCPDEFKIVSILSQYRKYTLCCCCCSRVKFKIRFLADRQTSLTSCFVFKDAVLVCIKLRVCLFVCHVFVWLSFLVVFLVVGG